MIKTGEQILATDFVLSTTAGEALSARDACYISTADGKAYKCDADDLTKIDFVGFAQEAAALNASVNLLISGLAGGFTLTRNEDYFLSSVAGEITTTPPALAVKVGKAISTSVLRILPAAVKACVRAYKSDSNTAATSSYVKVTFGTENFDDGDDFASSTFTAPRAGRYIVNAVAGGTSTGSATARSISLAIYKNGSVYSENHVSKVGATSIIQGTSISDIVALAEGDTVEIYIKTASTAEFTYNTGANNTFVSVVEL